MRGLWLEGYIVRQNDLIVNKIIFWGFGLWMEMIGQIRYIFVDMILVDIGVDNVNDVIIYMNDR